VLHKADLSHYTSTITILSSHYTNPFYMSTALRISIVQDVPKRAGHLNTSENISFIIKIFQTKVVGFKQIYLLTKEPRELENSDFDESLHKCRGGK